MSYPWRPDFVVHPGETVKEELEELGILGKAKGKTGGRSVAAKILGMTLEELSALIDCEPEGRITERAAQGLSAISASAAFWNNLQRNYDEGIARGLKPF